MFNRKSHEMTQKQLELLQNDGVSRETIIHYQRKELAVNAQLIKKTKQLTTISGGFKNV